MAERNHFSVIVMACCTLWACLLVARSSFAQCECLCDPVCDSPACDAGGCGCGGMSNTLLGSNYVERMIENKLDCVERRFNMPVGFGAYHWWQVDASGRGNNGYGVRNLRGTYFYYLTAAPEIDLGCGHKIGGYTDMRFRDGQPWRSFMNRTVWPYEAYAYYANDQLGKLKAGSVLKRVGLDWGGGFWPVISNFDGYMQDPDYGLSWEKTWDHCRHFKVDTFVQYFFHSDGFDGTFAGAGAESFGGINEKDTGVVRISPSWTWDDGSSVVMGIGGQVGRIDSNVPTFRDSVVAAWAVDATYRRGNWALITEVIQTLGRVSPARYVSGGPSNRITDYLASVEYTTGPVLWRATYSIGIDENPYGRHEFIKLGNDITVTEHLNFIIEYVKEDVNNAAGGAEFFDAFEFIVFWHF